MAAKNETKRIEKGKANQTYLYLYMYICKNLYEFIYYNHYVYTEFCSAFDVQPKYIYTV